MSSSKIPQPHSSSVPADATAGQAGLDARPMPGDAMAAQPPLDLAQPAAEAAKPQRRVRAGKKRLEDDEAVTLAQSEAAAEPAAGGGAGQEAPAGQEGGGGSSPGPGKTDAQATVQDGGGIAHRTEGASAEGSVAVGPMPEAAPLVALLGASWGVLGAMGTGGGSAAAAAAGFTLTGSIVAGPVLGGHGLTVTAYRADGTILGSSVVNSDGSYSIAIKTAYAGSIMVRVVDTTAGADYRDEATNTGKDLGTDLRAVTVVNGSGTYTVNLNPVTELAVRELGLNGGDSGASEIVLGSRAVGDIVQANTDIAKALGLNSTDIVKDQVVAIVHADGSANTAANNYGRVLAAISGQESTTGRGSDQVLADIAAAVNGGTLSTGGQGELIAGAKAAGEGAVAMAALLGQDATAASETDAAWAALHAAADGIGNGSSSLTEVQYAAIGVTGVDNTAKAALLGNAIDLQAPGAADSLVEVQALADAVNKVMQHAAGTSQPITQAELQALGISGLTALRATDLLNRIAASADDGTGVDTLAELQALVDTIGPNSPTLSLAADTGIAADISTATDKVTSNGRVNVGGLEAGASWEYSTDGGTSWTAGTGSYFTLTGDGAKSVQVRQTDAAGNPSTASSAFNFMLDSTAPNATLNTSGPVAAQSSEAGTAYLVRDTVTVTTLADITGAADNLWNSMSVATANSGNALDLTGLTVGTYRLYAVDVAGNLSAPASITHVVPVTTSVSNIALSTDSGAPGDFITNTALQTITATLSAALGSGETLQGSLDGGTTWVDISSKVIGTALSWDAVTLSGSSSIQLKVREGTSNDGPPASQSYVLDSAVATPTLSLAADTGIAADASTATDKVTSNGRVDVSGLEAGASWEYSTDGGTSWTAGTGSYFTLTGNGAKSVQVRQMDVAGNPSAASSAFNFTLDGTVATPTLSLAADTGIAADASTATDKVTSNGRVDVSGLEAGASWEYSTNGGTSWTAGTGSYFTLTGNGAKSVQVRQTDVAGNVSTASSAFNFMLDGTPPLATLASVVSPTMLEATDANGVSVTNRGDEVPQISALGSSGEFVVTWYGWDGTDNSIYVQKFAANGSPSGSPVRLEATNANGLSVTSGGDFTPQISALGSSGEFVVTWEGNDGTDSSIYVQKFAANGSPSGSPVLLEATNANGLSVTSGGDFNTQITAVGSTGEFVVTWAGNDGTDSSIYVQKFNVDGSKAGSPVLLEATNANGLSVTSGGDFTPQISAVGSTGEFVVTWEGNDGTDSSIYVQKFNVDGSKAGSPVLLEATDANGQSVTSGDDFNTQVTALGSGGEFVVTWEGWDGTDSSIYVQKFAANGSPSGSPVMLEATGVTNGSDVSPQVAAVGSTGEFVVTWQGNDGTDNSIYVQKFAANGSPSGSPVMLEATGVTNGSDVSPQVAAVGSTGEFVVTWYGWDGTDTSIYVQKFAANGSPSGSPVMMEGQVTGQDSRPQISAVGATGEFVVTWTGQDSGGDTSIFVQRFNADGTPKGVPAVQSSETGTAYLVRDTVTVITLADITGAADNQWNSMSVATANSGIALDLAGLAAGTYRLYTADVAGNLSAAASTTYVVPVSTSVGNIALSTDSGGAGDFITNTALQTITATLSAALGAGERLLGSVDGGATWVDISAKVTNTTLSWDGATLSGSSSIQLKVSEGTSNDGPVASQSYVLDTTVATPTLALAADTGIAADVSTATDKVTSNGRVDVSGLEAGASWEYSTNGGTSWTAGSGSGSGSYFTLTGDGTKSVQVRQTDVAGNVSTASSAFNFMLDGTPPLATLASVVSPTMLEATGVTNGYDETPQISALGSGGAFVVTWMGRDNSGGDRSIYVQKFNADGSSAGTPVMLEATGVPIGHDWEPQISALGSDGAFVVTWRGNDGSDESIYVQKFGPNGSPVGSPVMLEATGVTSGNDFNPQVTAVGSGGAFVVTWRGVDSGGDYSVYVQKFNADGSQAVPVMLEATASGNDDSPQVVALGSGGEFAVTWRGYDGTDNSIYVQKFDANGGAIGSPSMLEATGVANGSDDVPQIAALGSAGEFVVTWQGGNGTTTNIYVQKFGTNGSPAGSPVMLDAAGVSSVDMAPQVVAVGDTGGFVVTWLGINADGSSSVYVQKFSADGSQAVSVALDGRGANGLSVASGFDGSQQVVALGSAGEFVVAWSGDDAGGDASIWVQKFNADGSRSGSQVMVESTGVTAGSDAEPQVAAVGSNGEFVVTWTGFSADTTTSNIYVQRFNADGSPKGVPFAQSSETGTAYLVRDTVTVTTLADITGAVDNLWNSAGIATANSGIAVDTTGLGVGTYRLYTADVAGNLSAASSTTYVVPVATSVSNIALSTDSGAVGDFITNTALQTITATLSAALGSGESLQGSLDGGTTWVDISNKVTGTTLSWDAVTLSGSSSIQLKVREGTSNDGPLASRNYVLDSTPPAATLLAKPATMLEAPGETAGIDQVPQIGALGSSGEFVVTWYGTDSVADGSDFSVYVQKFNANGSQAGGPVRLEATGVTSGTDARPQIAAVGSGSEFVVTWYGHDGTDNSIYVQKFGTTGSPIGSPVLLEATGVANGSDVSPQVAALGTLGAFVVTWQGVDIGGDDSIYVQKFNADGTQAAPVMLEATGVPAGLDQIPQISALGSTGEFVVTWKGTDSGGDDSIYVQKFDATGSAVGSPVMLEATGVTTRADIDPQVAAVGIGDFVVTWSGQDGVSNYSVYVQKFGSTGSPSGSPVRLEATGVTDGLDGNPQVTALGSGGAFVVTWDGWDGVDASIYVQKFDATGSAVGSPVMLEATGVTSGADVFPQVAALGSTGAFVVTWHGWDGTDTSLYVQKFNADGTQATPVMLEATGVTNSPDANPQVAAVGSNGEFAVTWQGKDNDGGDFSIFVQRFNADGTKAGDPAVAQSTEAGTAYLVSDTVTVITLADITGAADSLWNSAGIATANSNTAVDTAGLGVGSYHLYTVDVAGNLSAMSAASISVL